MALSTEKLLPQNVDAEVGVLGSLQIDPSRLVAVQHRLRPAHFYREAHRIIYQAILDLDADGKACDLITLCDELARRGKLDDVGGASYVWSLANQVPTSVNIESYAAIVERTAIARQLIQAAGQIAGIAYNEADARVALTQAQRLLQDIAAGALGSRETTLSYGALLDTLFADILDRMEQPNAGITTGIGSLDTQLGGLEPGDLVYLCGRPGSGKSAFGVGTLAVGIARRFYAQWLERQTERVDPGTGAVQPADTEMTPQVVQVITLEMRSLQQVRRIVSSVASVNTRVLRAGFRMPDGRIDIDAYHATKERAYADKAALERTLYIDERPTTLEKLRSDVLTAAATRNLAVVVIDQLDLISDEPTRGSRGKQSEYERITTFSRTLKQIAQEANVAIICLAQLSREIEKRQNRRPMLSDLRSSGQLEQDADIVLGLYRGAYYDAARARKELAFAQFAELGLLKFRDGEPNAMTPLRYEGPFTRFGEWPNDWEWPADDTRGMEG